MKNKEIQTQPYVAPLIEVFEVKVEQGFAGSYTGSNEELGNSKEDFGWENFGW